jgi:hypothetical protein
LKIKKTLEKTEGATKNENSRGTGNIRHTRQKRKTNKTKINIAQKTQKTKKISNTDPPKSCFL